MALRGVSKINLHTRLGRYLSGCGITDRYRRVSAGSATVLQAYGIEPYCRREALILLAAGPTGFPSGPPGLY